MKVIMNDNISNHMFEVILWRSMKMILVEHQHSQATFQIFMIHISRRYFSNIKGNLFIQGQKETMLSLWHGGYVWQLRR